MSLPVQSVGIRQRKVTDSSFLVTGTGTAAITEGKFLATLVDNGTGDYTITLNDGGARTCVVVGAVAQTANLQPQIVSQSGSAVRIKWTDNSGTATDCVFNITIRTFGAASQS